MKTEPYLELPLLFQSPGGLNSCFLGKEVFKKLSCVMDGYNPMSQLSECILR